ncbi:MAG: SAM-dependent methyltransferase [Comamonadaceae bacterium]|nr:SAM-dependent methyltransferase [Comamonadaceae bacterium]
MSAELRARQEAHAGRAGRSCGCAIEVRWIDRLPVRSAGVVVANEVLDALPVERGDPGGEAEACMQRGRDTCAPGRFELADRPLRRQAARAKRRTGSRARASPAREAAVTSARSAWPQATLVAALGERCWCAARSSRLATTAGTARLTTIRSATRGTLMCRYRQRAHADPFVPGLGLQDITAHVELRRRGAGRHVGAGLALLGYTSQAHFLVNLGITELLAGLHVRPMQAARYAPRRGAGAEAAAEPGRDARAVQGASRSGGGLAARAERVRAHGNLSAAPGARLPLQSQRCARRTSASPRCPACRTRRATCDALPASQAAHALRGRRPERRRRRAVLCLHGEPSWAYLYRKHAPGVRTQAGHRAWWRPTSSVSAAPTSRSTTRWYTFELPPRRAARASSSALDLRNVLLVVQDWGGLLGLTLPMELPERYHAAAGDEHRRSAPARVAEGFAHWRAYGHASPTWRSAS